MVTFGGDDVNGVVFDFGSRSSRVGYAGEDLPRSSIPSYTARDTNTMSDSAGPLRVGEYACTSYRLNTELRRIVKDGLIVDWEGLEAMWDHSYSQVLRTDSALHPLMMTETTWTPKEDREKLVEIAFEKYNVPAFYLGNDAILSAFSAGKSTGIVVNSGADTTSVVPIYDSYILQKGVQKQSVAGESLSQHFLALAANRKLEIVPQYTIKTKEAVNVDMPAKYTVKDTPDTHTSFHDFAVRKVVNDIKASLCATLEVAFDANTVTMKPPKFYEFPNGFNTSFRNERYIISESMFNPKLIYSQDPQHTDLSLHHLIHQSIQTCDPDIRALMYQNIVLTGGNTMFPGFTERLQFELSYLAPGMKIKIHAAQSGLERASASWVGGSILASLGTFHQLWISKAEYEEVGARVVELR